jgi:hypothetical protein
MNIEIKHEEDGRWSVYDDGYRVVSFYSREAAAALKSLIMEEHAAEMDERETEKAIKEEIVLETIADAKLCNKFGCSL